jgi:molybdate-binding protein/DNA-binding transcriptional regulator YhcF (GntR family)
MEETVLYHKIADAIRKEIITGQYKPGDRLPSVRKLCEVWRCTPGTIQRAYNELAREGLLISRAGRGTQVAGPVPQAQVQAMGTLRRANLVNRMEATLLEALTAGYSLDDIQQAMDLALDRWRSLSMEPADPPAALLRFSGSHDMVMNEIAHTIFPQVAPGISLQLNYTGSLGGLIALAEGKADLAGCHLWDAETGGYNLPFARRLLPGKDITAITLAHRRIGLMMAPGNPRGIRGLADLAQAGVRFVNRQAGSGTRVWLDEALEHLGVDAGSIQGYADERLTHSDVARAVADGDADVGLGLETAAQAYGIDFLFLNRERYDLIMLSETAARPAIQNLVAWLRSEQGKAFVARRPGYEAQSTGAAQSVR